jgi:hypothetical protein
MKAETSAAETTPDETRQDLGATFDKRALDRHLEDKIQALQQHLAAARAEMELRAESRSQACTAASIRC